MKAKEKERKKKFVCTVWRYYRAHKRSFPWRRTRDPYHILVSEVMLQQTQASRVVGKYREFIKRFPHVSTLASAPFADVLRMWQGLGYNRRALYLHKAAKIIVREYKGKVPQDPAALGKLPGIGRYSARAILTFAHDEPQVFIETNIRSVFLHHFFPAREKVGDAELLPLIEATLPPRDARNWYAALMDYGAYLKTQGANPSQRSAHHIHQKPFRGSEREVRGALLRRLTSGPESSSALAHSLPFPQDRIEKNLFALMKDGLISKKKNTYALAT